MTTLRLMGITLVLMCFLALGKAEDIQNSTDATLVAQQDSDVRRFFNMLPKIAENVRSVIDSVSTGVTTTDVCSTCQEAAEAFRIAIKRWTKDDFINYKEFVCEVIEEDLPSDVCLGLLESYVDSIFDIGNLALKEGISERDCCALMFGPTCGNVTAAAHVWEVSLPDPLKKPLRKYKVPGMDKIDILHLSDFHFDPNYRAGALAQCPLPLCCRQIPAAQNSTEPDPSSLAGRFGDLRHCDMPFETIESLVNDAANFTKKGLSHIYLTGDIPPHDVWKADEQEYFNTTKSVYDLLKERFSVKIFPVVGNHDAVPPNMFSTKNGSTFPERHSPQLYSNLASFWSSWLGDEQQKTILLGGFYAVPVSPALKVIALNTNFCYRLNFWLIVDSRDPAGQLKWLVEQLEDSESHGQKVHILGHVSPGSSDCIYSWSTQFLRIVQRFSTTITGQFYGHTHYDEFRVFYAPNRVTPVGAAFIAPSATSYSHVNPAYKKFTYSEKGVLLDAWTRTFNLTEANRIGRIDWVTEYRTRHTYFVKDLSPASMDAISKKLSKDSIYFQAYYRFYHRLSPDAKWSNCTEQCREAITCTTRTDVHHDDSACHRLS